MGKWRCHWLPQFASSSNGDMIMIQSPTNEETAYGSSLPTETTKRSCIRKIRSRNLGGISSSNDNSQQDILIAIPPNETLITITGETGTGKSLLFARALDLITGKGGGTAAQLLLPENETTAAFAEIEIELHEPWSSAIPEILSSINEDIPFNEDPKNQTTTTLTLRRTLTPTVGRHRRSVKSICEMNGEQVPLATLVAVAAPLIKVVDAAAASSALALPDSRLAVIDTGVVMGASGRGLIQEVRTRHARYRDCLAERERLERDISNLPYDPTDDTAEMLTHWIKELDVFSKQATKLCRSIVAPHDGDDILVSKEDRSMLDSLSHEMAFVMWDDDDDDSDDSCQRSGMHECLLRLRNEIRSLDDQLISTKNAIDALSMMSIPNSAAAALEQSRNFLFEITPDSLELNESTEKCHEYLNRLEEELSSCVRFLEDDEKGPLKMIEQQRAKCHVSVEQLDDILVEWSSLARKHGVQPQALPACHRSLLNEQDGGEEIRARLPQILADERTARSELDRSCRELHHERKRVAAHLSDHVTRRLASLGMGDSSLQVLVVQDRNETTASATGYDAIRFILEKSDVRRGSDPSRKRRGDLTKIASSGEKARLLLAIECVLPGSVAAATTANSADTDSRHHDLTRSLPPVAVLYDEIDAHVGGQAAVALSRMLRDQAAQSSQVLTITHSPPVAAMADMHVVVEKEQKIGTVAAKVLCTLERRNELARMASGNVAAEEALVFAEALLREGKRGTANPNNGHGRMTGLSS